MANVLKWPLEDREKGCTDLRLSPSGFEATRFGLVETADLYDAVKSIPDQMGAAFDTARLPKCQAFGYSAKWWRGPKSGVATDLGHAIVRVEYRTSGINGRLPPPLAWLVYTQLSCASESIQVYFDVNQPPGTGPLNGPIANGEGAPKLVGTVQATVTSYRSAGLPFDMTRLIDLARRKCVNDTPLALPAVLGTAQAFTMAPGQARFESFTGPEPAENGTVKLQVVLALAPDFKFRWRLEDDSGFGVADQANDLYEAANLAGLW